MKHCVNHNHPEIKELAKSLGLPKLVVASKVALWQEQNTLDRFPSLNELQKKLDPFKKKEIFTIPLIKKDQDGKIIEDNTGLYEEYNLLNEKGEIKILPDDKATKKWLTTLNESPYYSFFLRNTPSGKRILIYPKQIDQLTLFNIGITESQNTDKLFPDNDTTSNKQVINIIKENGSEIEKELVTLLEPFIDETAPVEFTENLKNEGALGQFSYLKNQASDIKIRNSANNKIRVFLHELTHEATIRQIHQYELDKSKLNKEQIEAIENLEKLYNTVKDETEDYGFTNLGEFVSEIWSNEEFRNKLNKIKYQNSNVLSKILEYIFELLDINNNTALSEAFKESYKLIENSNNNIELGVTEATLNLEDKKQESAFTKQEIYFANRIKRLTKELDKLEEGTTKYENLKKELDTLKEKFNTAKTLQSTNLFRELGTEVLDSEDAFITQLEDGLAEDVAKSIEHSIEVINTFKDFDDLRDKSAKLLNRLKPFIDELKVDEVQEYATEKEKPTLEDIEKQDTDISKRIANTGSLSDLANYIGRTIGSIIKSVQNKVETYTKKTKKEIEKEVKALNEYAKKNGATLEDTYKLFVQQSNNTLGLVQPFFDNGKENPNWNTILNNPELLQFYNFYVTKITQAQDGLPVNFGKSFIPNIRKLDFKSKIKSLSIVKERTIKDGFEEDNLADVVPLEYHKSISVDEKSSDLGTILFEFDKYAYNQKEMTNILPKLRLLQESLTYKIVNGNYIERQFRSANNPNLTIPGNKTNLYNMIEKIIDMQVKGNMKLEEFQFVTSETTNADGDTVQTVVDGAKAADLLLKFNSLLRIGLSPITAVTNWLFGDISNAIEAVGGQYFNLKQLHQASKIFFKQNFDRDSVLNKLLEELNPLQELTDYSLKADIEQIGNTKLTTDRVQEIMYSMQTSGEKFLQSRTLLAVMINEGYLTSNGELTDKYNNIDEKEKQQLIDKVQRLNQKIHGRYSQKEAAALQQNVLFRLVSQFRKWIFAAVENRINKEQYDNRLQQTIEGSYRTFGRLVLSNWKNPKQAFENLLLPLIDAKKLLKEGKLTEFEVYNMRKMAMELISIGTLTMLYAFLHGGDDDKDKLRRRLPEIKLALTLLDRASGDLIFFYSPEKINELGKNALPISKTIGDILQAMVIIPKVLYTGDYTIKKGSSKGRNRVAKEFSDITPLAKPAFELYKIGRRDISLEEQR